MIYFNTNDNKEFIKKMDIFFGKHTKGKNDNEYHWKEVEMNEWSKKSLEIKLINMGGYISIAIVDDSNITLTDKKHEKFKEIKSFFKTLKNSLN